MSALRVFLDSSDYSVLSAPDAGESKYATVLSQLREFRDAGVVTFYFTGPQIAEMAPLDPVFGSSAIRRAALLVEICGKNCLISPERIIANEVSTALGLPGARPEPWSLTGDWIPEGALDLVAISPQERRLGILEAIDEQPANRASRRAMKRKLLKPSARARLERGLVEQSRRDQAALDIQRRYPMRLEDARILARYIAGDASASQATAAFASSVGDPCLFYQWMVHQPDAALKFMDWVRAPARRLNDSVKMFVDQTSRMRDLHAQAGMEDEVEELIRTTWESKSDAALFSMVTRFAKELLRVDSAAVNLTDIHAHCPGLACAVGSMHESWRASLQKKPRKPKDSDFPDMLHALYAPYVDLFRADSFMAPIIARHVKGGEQRVVAKLTQLPEAIRLAL